MISRNEFSIALEEIRNSLGFGRGVSPIIQEIVERENWVHVIVPNRAEKSLLLGPGGRVVASLSKRFGKPLTIHSDLQLKSRRCELELTSRRINEIYGMVSENQKSILDQLKKDIEKEMRYPEETSRNFQVVEATTAVAFSGGVDSGAALAWANHNLSSVVAVTVDLGQQVFHNNEKSEIMRLTQTRGISHIFLEASAATERIFSKAMKGDIHPCGLCHSELMKRIMEHVKGKKIDTLLTGQLLPAGRQSIEFNDNLMQIHLPAALSLTKFRTTEFAEDIGINADDSRFGCFFLSKCHNQGWKSLGPSIFRVLRETNAGVISTGQALDLMKHIVKPNLIQRGQREPTHEGE